MDWKQLLASITRSVDEELHLRNAYLVTENRILRQQMAGRVPLSDGDRLALAEIGQKLRRKALAEIATIAKPDIILAWHRKRVAQPCDGTPPRTSIGRPRIDKELENLVVRMARENRSWEYNRIVGALLNLGYRISDQTVGNILKHHGIPPAPVRKTTTTWKEFIRIHMAVLGATAFFSSVVWGWWGLMISCLLSWLCFARAQTCGMRMTLYHQGRRMRLILRQALAGHPYGQSSVQAAQQDARHQLLLCGAGVLGTLVAASTCPEKRQPRTQHKAQVVCVSTASHRRIRDGPRRRQPWRDGLGQNDACEAA